MAVATRRPAIAVTAGALAAVALAAAVGGRSCRVDEDSPTGAVRAFVDAAAADDRDAMLELLGPETRRRLERAAVRATERVGGSGRYAVPQMISVGRFGDGETPRRYRVVSQSDTRAIVEVVGKGERRDELVVVRHEGRWKLEIPGYGADL